MHKLAGYDIMHPRKASTSSYTEKKGISALGDPTGTESKAPDGDDHNAVFSEAMDTLSELLNDEKERSK